MSSKWPLKIGKRWIMVQVKAIPLGTEKLLAVKGANMTMDIASDGQYQFSLMQSED